METISKGYRVASDRGTFVDDDVIGASSDSHRVVQIDRRDNLLGNLLGSPVESDIGFFLVLLVLDADIDEIAFDHGECCGDVLAALVPAVNHKLFVNVHAYTVISMENEGEGLGLRGEDLARPADTNKVRDFISDQPQAPVEVNLVVKTGDGWHTIKECIVKVLGPKPTLVHRYEVKGGNTLALYLIGRDVLVPKGIGYGVREKS